MKKLLALILALVMCFSLVACGGDKKDDEAGKPAESAKPSASQGTSENNQPAAPDPEKEYKKEFVIGLTSGIKGWDPTRDNTVYFVWLYNLVWDSLLSYDLMTGAWTISTETCTM